ncbi:MULTISPECIES: aldehyde dehydrogenase family protein [unclassified Bradyrhizobium]|uniref:aldehyde dehydrogenase family protein n=1 Tax=unclassified Bradyrhizobium TaxID=2631580 RepID=UPI001BA9CC88|nr:MULTISPECIES: aldehyde dehydrogenase family protein [unclassified Bradyrhizobium]MBR1202057.1 aldehyde dehydrogenase family protein [Bradyrhizobium sp. AUGA SZCCT0124]MBR1311374.1 aldehyde dehydrogenase family protein [Bradyrhizobium sp. AUGA SZCCT0051]MBR1339006.1 aldehyde dehydrogenase family protein [Bradyrhizobium sp. AUGA SZCCT0105]MBR1353580.1 aldehyde dehydrogenase family protein [Bradyrhizobium sp. AUGA SZCCT0045]
MSVAYDYERDAHHAPTVRDELLVIDGTRVRSLSGKTFKSLNPATEQVIATIAEGNELDVDRAVAAARRAFEGPWRTMRAAKRGHILLKWAELLKQHADEIAALESLDAGKPISAVLRQDFPAAIDTLTYYAGWADKISGDVVSTRDDALTYTVREPVGVVAAIVPWNFPLMIGMWKLAPALACGCTVVMKPAELTSLSALRIGEVALEAGLPKGVLNIVTGPGRVVGDALVNHPDVDKVTFTGSPGVGRGIMKGAAGNFKRVSLELGGKSANVIFDDANLEAAAKAAAAGIFFNAGQVCSAGSRVLVQENAYDEVVERLVARAEALRIGDPADRATVLGPVISEKQMRSILDYVEIGKNEGAHLATGGARVGDRGYFISPAVFANVAHEMRISQEEIFGPVVSVIKFKDEADALRIANGTAYSLAAGVWSADMGRVQRFAKKARAGTVWINTYGYTDVRLPWGGERDSGLGREHGTAALDNFTEPKAVWMNLNV